MDEVYYLAQERGPLINEMNIFFLYLMHWPTGPIRHQLLVLFVFPK